MCTDTDCRERRPDITSIRDGAQFSFIARSERGNAFLARIFGDVGERDLSSAMCTEIVIAARATGLVVEVRS